MTPLLLVPSISRPDLLASFIASIDDDVQLVVVDNSPDGSMYDVTPDGAHYIPAPWGMGVGPSWNLVVKVAPADPYWLLGSNDTVLAPGDLARLKAAAASGEYGMVGMNGDWRIIGWTADCVDRVGLFDENLYPAYDEDCDMEYRCTLAGVRWGFIEGGATHVRSAAIRSDPRLAARNAVTHGSNDAYYVAKWGGLPRGGETYTTPFDQGGSVKDWTLDRRRWVENRW